MRRLLITIIGLALFVAGALTLYLAHAPQRTEARTTGGTLFTQEEIASGEANISAVTESTAGVMQVPVQPALSAEAASDLSTMDAAEAQTAPMMTGELEGEQQTAVAGANLTTDVVLGMDTEVAVAPLAAEADTVAPPGGQGGLSATSATGYEQRVVELEWPQQFQAGRSGTVRVKLKMLESGALQPVAEIADNEVLATPILINDRYNVYDAFVTANLAAPDFKQNLITPARQRLLPGEPVEWRWTLESDDAQTSVIVITLNLSWEGREGGAPGPQNVPIWGQAVQVEVNYVFGLISVPQASVVGTVLGVLGLIGQFPLLEKVLEIVLDIIFGRDRRRDDRRSRRRRQESNRRRR